MSVKPGWSSASTCLPNKEIPFLPDGGSITSTDLYNFSVMLVTAGSEIRRSILKKAQSSPRRKTIPRESATKAG